MTFSNPTTEKLSVGFGLGVGFGLLSPNIYLCFIYLFLRPTDPEQPVRNGDFILLVFFSLADGSFSRFCLTLRSHCHGSVPRYRLTDPSLGSVSRFRFQFCLGSISRFHLGSVSWFCLGSVPLLSLTVPSHGSVSRFCLGSVLLFSLTVLSRFHARFCLKVLLLGSPSRFCLVLPPADGYGPVFEEQPVNTIYPEESPEARITMHCRARASPSATYR